MRIRLFVLLCLAVVCTDLPAAWQERPTGELQEKAQALADLAVKEGLQGALQFCAYKDGKCIATMPYRGRWISLASMAGPETTLDVNLLWRKNLRVIGSTLRSRTPEEKAQILAGLVRDVYPAFEACAFAPFVHKVMPIAEATEAHAILERGENRGKVVLTV